MSDSERRRLLFWVAVLALCAYVLGVFTVLLIITYP